MDIISDFAESVETKQSHDFERNTEEFEVVKVGTVNNKFNFTLQNTGNIPVNVTRLWVQNTTDSAWPTSKFNINTAIAPGATITNVGQNIDLVSLSTQSYLMKLVTERGSSQKLFLNSVGEESLYLKLHAAPT
ncbi:MAG: LamG domain-containing protein, partial [Thaumarchaeota archaeon]|nr:LamG domain-containing protein [Nitrososphaerota archaeon]